MTHHEKKFDARRPTMSAGHVGIVGAPVAMGQGKGGVANGPQALREAGMVDRIESLGYDVTDHGDLRFEVFNEDPPQWNMKNPKATGSANKKIAESVADVVSSGQTCVTIGGDHSMAIGSIYGHAQVNPDLVVVWVDAHADINPPMASASGNIHGMPVAFLMKELEEYVPKVDSFNWLKPCLSAKDIVYIGLRDVDAAERYIIENLGIRAYTMRDVDRYGIVKVMKEALEAVNPGLKRPIHLSFDVDGLDPGVTPSTGTPVPGGLTIREGIFIVEELALTDKLAAIDIAEVNPDIGMEKDKEVTLYTSLEILSSCFKNRRPHVIPEKFEIPRHLMEKV